VEEALLITKFAKKVTIVHRSPKFRANEIAVEHVMNHPKVEVLFNHEPKGFVRDGDKMITTLENRLTGEQTQLVADGVFVFIGLKSNVDMFGDTLPVSDQWGYLLTDDEMRTNLPDVYAIGDIVSKKYRQITTAVADGTIAAISISKEM